MPSPVSGHLSLPRMKNGKDFCCFFSPRQPSVFVPMDKLALLFLTRLEFQKTSTAKCFCGRSGRVKLKTYCVLDWPCLFNCLIWIFFRIVNLPCFVVQREVIRSEWCCLSECIVCMMIQMKSLCSLVLKLGNLFME